MKPNWVLFLGHCVSGWFQLLLIHPHHHYVPHKQGCFLYLPSILSRMAVLGSRCSTAIEWSGGCEFESRSFFTSLSFSHSVSLWCVHSQVPWGGETPLIFRREKWMLRCAAGGNTSLISTNWGKIMASLKMLSTPFTILLDCSQCQTRVPHSWLYS